MRTLIRGIVVTCVVVTPAVASAQINFQKTSSYAALGDSVAAGEGAMPVTTAGYA